MVRHIKSSAVGLNGQVVEFSLRDVHFPDRTSILHELHDDDVLTGKVVELSRDARREGDVFVGVQVEGLKQRCYVPADRVHRIGQRLRR
jgi:hypothetical protein